MEIKMERIKWERKKIVCTIGNEEKNDEKT